MILERHRNILRSLSVRGYSFYIPRVPSIITQFDMKWKDMSESEKEKLEAQYESLKASDWRTLTVDQKRARKKILS